MDDYKKCDFDEKYQTFFFAIAKLTQGQRLGLFKSESKFFYAF